MLLRSGEGKQATARLHAQFRLPTMREVTDEFVVPTVVCKRRRGSRQRFRTRIPLSSSTSVRTVQERSHSAFCDDEFTGFDARDVRPDVTYVCFTDYDATIPNKLVAFKKEDITNTFGEFLAAQWHRSRQESLRPRSMHTLPSSSTAV